MPVDRLPRRALFAQPREGWRRARGGQTVTWQRSVKAITSKLSCAGHCRLPGWGPRDGPCQWLEIVRHSPVAPSMALVHPSYYLQCIAPFPIPPLNSPPTLPPSFATNLPHLPESSVDKTVAATTTVRQIKMKRHMGQNYALGKWIEKTTEGEKRLIKRQVEDSPSQGLSNKSWLYGSEASVLNTDVVLSMMMMPHGLMKNMHLAVLLHCLELASD
ncbi:hypothetical protein T265_07117 [Opisthorchis viverrini]|uniref:Uncharacterized protein n=1 Tax=Opisthorchis viverrini TaxID=6198 RepID=A0A074ZDS1_OPIVI|nr:hypothetical protein T265_07117 [Opisthorchis viverrini]KER25436.1 hypothetical protein T265_07117 [Opisthorchis viverrini]